MNASDGSDWIRLTYSEGNDLAPAWSPDGNWITFVSARVNEVFEVFIIGADGQNEANLTNHEKADSNPRWLPAKK